VAPLQRGKIRREMQRNASIPLPPQRNAGPLDKDLLGHRKMTPVHSVKQVPTWATEKPTPHIGKPNGLARGSWNRPKIMQIISEKRH
jgi:hypothetical protein